MLFLIVVYMLYIAHRGFRVDVDENTFQAFDKSIELGMDFIELDVQLTKDNKLCVLHDVTLDRTFGVSGKISKKRYGEIKDIKSRTFQSSIPLFSEVIQKYIIENKSNFLFICNL